MISEQLNSASLDRWQRVDQILELAFDLPPEERESTLDRECAGDSELRRTVQELLDAEEASGPFLQESLPAKLGVTEGFQCFEDREASTSPGQQVGVYKLDRRLGRGGMGEVWLARRADGEFEHTVAIKLLDAQMDSAATRERLRRERQMLARLDHPNIARLLDGGTLEDGRPYFVMERVEGERIDLFCTRRQLSLIDRLHLVLELADAVAAAHNQGMIHRDLKPSNVLVTPEGTVKLVDFGIAKRVPEEASGRSFDGHPTLSAAGLTLTGQRPMTPGYASPEQVRGEAVTVSTDIYSLGALCYELLTGCRPFAVDGLPVYAMEQAVCERPVRLPSDAILSGTPQRISAADGADLPLTPPQPKRELRRLLQPDLDRILFRALSKNAGDRHASVDEFAGRLKEALGKISAADQSGTLFPVLPLSRVVPALLLVLMALSLQGFSTQSIGGSADGAPWAVRLPQMDEILQATVPRGPRLLFIPFRTEEGRKQPMTFLLTKALWAGLSSRQDVQVIGERSAFEVLQGGAGRNTLSMAAAVDADFVLIGQTAGEDSSFRLETSLLWGVDGRTVWSKDYPLKDADVPAILNDIITASARALGLSTAAVEDTSRFVAGWSTTEETWPSEAALNFAIGYYLSQRGPTVREKAEQHILHALEEDSRLAPAWTLLAQLHRSRMDVQPDSEARAFHALQQALELNPRDHMAHLSLGSLHLERLFDLEGASASLLRSLRELPMFTPSIFTASWMAGASGDLEAAIILAQRSARLDPLDAMDQQNAAQMLYAAGRLEEAMEHLEVSRVLDPERLGLEFLRSRILLARGDSKSALEVAQLESNPGFRALGIALTEYAVGNQQASDEALHWLIANHSELFAYQIAQAYACRGELQEALHWLRTAAAQQDPGLTNLRKEPCFVTLRDETAMQQLVAEILPIPQGSTARQAGAPALTE